MGSGCWSGWRRRVRCCQRRQHGAWRQRPAGLLGRGEPGGLGPAPRVVVLPGIRRPPSGGRGGTPVRRTAANGQPPHASRDYSTLDHLLPVCATVCHMATEATVIVDLAAASPRVSAAGPTGRTGEDGGRPLLPHLDRTHRACGDVRDVDARRLAGDEELLGDLVVACAVRDQAEHLDLARGESQPVEFADGGHVLAAERVASSSSATPARRDRSSISRRSGRAPSRSQISAARRRECVAAARFPAAAHASADRSRAYASG